MRLKISKIWHWGGFGVMQGLLLGRRDVSHKTELRTYFGTQITGAKEKRVMRFHGMIVNGVQ